MKLGSNHDRHQMGNTTCVCVQVTMWNRHYVRLRPQASERVTKVVDRLDVVVSHNKGVVAPCKRQTNGQKASSLFQSPKQRKAVFKFTVALCCDMIHRPSYLQRQVQRRQPQAYHPTPSVAYGCPKWWVQSDSQQRMQWLAGQTQPTTMSRRP